MHFVEFQRFFDGATRPFLSTSDSGTMWVVKVHGNPLGTKAIFNEYLVGKLAEAIGLPWPTVVIGELSNEIIFRLAQEKLKTESKWAVGVTYIDGLRNVDYPEDPLSPEFDKVNAQYIRRVLPNKKMYGPFYGKSVFDNWVLMEDSKYENLKIDQSGSPLFLDGSVAFGGLEWEVEKLRWEDTRIDFYQSPYLRGILTERDQFEPWLRRIGSIQKELIEKLLGNIPEEWHVPNDYFPPFVNFLMSAKEDFLPLFCEFVKWVFLSF